MNRTERWNSGRAFSQRAFPLIQAALTVAVIVAAWIGTAPDGRPGVWTYSGLFVLAAIASAAAIVAIRKGPLRARTIALTYSAEVFCCVVLTVFLYAEL